MDKMDKPRICDVLGVEVGEVFTIKGYPNRNYRYAVVHTDRKLHNYLEEPCQTTGTRIGNKIGVNAFYWLLDHPEAIIRKPCFTEEEIADAKTVWRMFPKVAIVSRGCAGHLIFGDKDKMVQFVLQPNAKVFPSLRPGQSVRLEDVLEANS